MDVLVGNAASTPVIGAGESWLHRNNAGGWWEWRKRTPRRLGLRLPKKRAVFYISKMTPAQHEEIQQPGPVWGALDPGAPWIPSPIEVRYWCSACRQHHPESQHHRDTSIGGQADREWFAALRRRIHGIEP